MNKQPGILLLFMGLATALHAAPKLRLTTTAVGPILVAPGSSGTINPSQLPYAYNIGDGTLNLKVSSSDSWLAPTLGTATNTCQGGIKCTPVQIALPTGSLAKGTYTGFVTVSDPNAVDSPQTISVTVAIGGNVPDQITLYVPPNGTAKSSFKTGNGAGATASTQSGGAWLSVAGSGFGSFQFTTTYNVTANATGLAAGDYNGSVAIAGSSFAADNRSVPVVLHVTTQPIAQPLFALKFTIALGAAKQKFFIAYPFYPLLTNAGQGTLTVSSGTAATSSGGSWLSLQSDPVNNGFFQLTADATGLSPGTYQGTVTINSNALNSPTVLPVQLTVLAAGPPFVSYQGVVNVFTGSPDDGLSQGDVVQVSGSQFTTGDPVLGTVPLGTSLGGTQVLLNGQPVPVQLVSPNQINIQIPYDAQLGDGALTVVRGGQQGNTLSVHINAAAPTLLPFQGSYVLAQTATGGYEGYSPAVPAHAGDTLVLYAVGFGATSPAVPAGTAAPGLPNLAMVTPTPTICFGQPNPINPTALCTAPQFAGLTPGFFGLYQLNFVVPDNAPKGDAVQIFAQVGNAVSNILSIAIQ